ncbi:MAG: phosphate transport system regulatory protein PhoU [Planctomycetaceae bacterium]|nr:phosphate transport system regulatory protein PhoU [Planctomycetaceae bacterium]|tara:strand:+ start:1529 stop:2179 length:651 start_codon:yes stop_codon:yes gene_type:complete
MRRFDQELSELHHQLIEMGTLAESMVSTTVRALEDLTLNIEESLQASEDMLDEMQNTIDKEVVRILTVYSPVATDLRYVLTVSHVTSSLERIGDQTTNVLRLLQLMMARSAAKPEPRIIQMGMAVKEMLHGAIGSYINRNAKEAEKYRNRDEYVDSLNDQIMREVLSEEVALEALQGEPNIAGPLAQILIARSLERIGDQACNICDQVPSLVATHS